MLRYIGFQIASQIPQSRQVFARLYEDGVTLEKKMGKSRRRIFHFHQCLGDSLSIFLLTLRSKFVYCFLTPMSEVAMLMALLSP